jgi:hypothetical protein
VIVVRYNWSGAFGASQKSATRPHSGAPPAGPVGTAGSVSHVGSGTDAQVAVRRGAQSPFLREEKQLLAAWKLGPPSVCPEVVISGRGGGPLISTRVHITEEEFAFRESLRRNSYALPGLLVPDLVTALTTPPPLRAHSAE